MGGESCRVLRLRWMRKLAMCLKSSQFVLGTFSPIFFKSNGLYDQTFRSTANKQLTSNRVSSVYLSSGKQLKIPVLIDAGSLQYLHQTYKGRQGANVSPKPWAFHLPVPGFYMKYLSYHYSLNSYAKMVRQITYLFIFSKTSAHVSRVHCIWRGVEKEVCHLGISSNEEVFVTESGLTVT